MKRVSEHWSLDHSDININKIPDRRRIATALKFSANVGSEPSRSLVDRRVPVDENTGKPGSEIASFRAEESPTVIGALALHAENFETNWFERRRIASLAGEIVLTAAKEFYPFDDSQKGEG